jgi:hypothetical protein
MYDAVGRDYDWTSRRKLSAAELAALLNDPRLEVHVLMAEGVPARFAELDRRIEGEFELHDGRVVASSGGRMAWESTVGL